MLHSTCLIDVARVVLLKEVSICSCILCGVEILEGEEMVCKLHAAQVLKKSDIFATKFLRFLTFASGFIRGARANYWNQRSSQSYQHVFRFLRDIADEKTTFTPKKERKLFVARCTRFVSDSYSPTPSLAKLFTRSSNRSFDGRSGGFSYRLPSKSVAIDSYFKAS